MMVLDHVGMRFSASMSRRDIFISPGVIDMTPGELRVYFSSALHDLEFSQSQDRLAALLAQIGERVQAFFRDFSDTSSKEDVVLQRLGYNGRLEDSTGRSFYYLILFNPKGKGPLLEEYRTDNKNRAIDQSVISGFFITSGYACLSLLFHPNHQ